MVCLCVSVWFSTGGERALLYVFPRWIFSLVSDAKCETSSRQMRNYGGDAHVNNAWPSVQSPAGSVPLAAGKAERHGRGLEQVDHPGAAQETEPCKYRWMHKTDSDQDFWKVPSVAGLGFGKKAFSEFFISFPM